MAVIYPHFLQSILKVHENLHNNIAYPFFDPACVYYEALRSVTVDGARLQSVIEKYGLTDYTYRKSLLAFQRYGSVGLIGLDSHQVTEDLPIEVERKIFVLKKARPWIPAVSALPLRD
ncbi:MAG: hypothetical protein ACMUIP_10540 [bacterium]